MTAHAEVPSASPFQFCSPYSSDPSNANGFCSWTLNVEDTVCETCTESKSNTGWSVTQVSCLTVATGLPDGRQFYWSIDQQKRSVKHPAAAPGRVERED